MNRRRLVSGIDVAIRGGRDGIWLKDRAELEELAQRGLLDDMPDEFEFRVHDDMDFCEVVSVDKITHEVTTIRKGFHGGLVPPYDLAAKTIAAYRAARDGEAV